MRKLILVVIGLFVGTGVAAAQSHQGMNEIPVKETMVFATDVKVGAAVLRAGEYRIECNRDVMKFYLVVPAKDAEKVRMMTPIEQSLFRDNGKKVLQVPCKGKELSAPRKTTEAVLDEKNGLFTLNVLYLKGSNVEHVF